MLARVMRSSLCWFLLLLLLLTGCFVDKPVTKLSRAGVELRKVDTFQAAASGRSMVLAPGDFVLSGAGMRVVFGGLRRDGEARGAVLEASYAGMAPSESLVLFRQSLYVNGVENRIRISRMFIIER